MLLVAGCLLAASAEGSSSSSAGGPPPIPACFKVAGPCEGFIFNTPPTVHTEESRDGIFTLASPAHPQTKTPVAVGCELCPLYNHFSWDVFGATVLDGCAQNDEKCKVQIGTSYSGWFPIGWQLNTDTPVVFLLWEGGSPPKYELSGTILASACGTGTCTSKPTPASGITVTAGGGSDTTNADGAYSITLPKGTYQVTPHSGTRPFDPASRTVTLTHDQGGVDFTTCPVAQLKGTLQRSSTARTTAAICTSALKVTFEVAPEKLVLDVGKDGAIAPGEETVKVIVTNISKETIKGVQLLTLGAEPVDPTQRLDPIRFPKGTLPVKFAGAFAPKSHASRTFKVKVTGDGEYQFRSLALYDDPSRPGGNGRALGVGGKFKSVVPLLFFSAKLDDENLSQAGGAPVVKAGATWYVSATIKNESSYQRLCVLPLAPTLAGNAAATGPIDISLGSVRKIGGPFAGVLPPGKKVSLSMYVDTSSTGASAGSVKFKPTAALLGPNGKCEAKTAGSLEQLTPAQMKVPEGSTSFSVHVDLSVQQVENAGKVLQPVLNTFNFFGGIAQNFFVDTFSDILGVVALARSASSLPDEYQKMNDVVPQSGYAARFAVAAGQLIYTATDVYANYWRTASDVEKENVFYRAGNVLYNVSGDFFGDAKSLVEDEAKPFMAQMEEAQAKGDDAEVWHLWGRATGTVLQQAVMYVFMNVLGAKIAADAPELEKVAAEAEEQWWLDEAKLPDSAPPDESLRTVPPGTAENLA